MMFFKFLNNLFTSSSLKEKYFVSDPMVTLYYPSGSIQYSGFMKDGKFHGQGTLYSENENVKYTGSWKNGQKDGHGTACLGNSYTYTGAWKNNMPNGIGKLYCKNMIYYIGNFSNGLFHGKGIEFFPSCECTSCFNSKLMIRYNGQWEHGKYHGHGFLFVKSFLSNCLFHVLYYNGVFQNGEFHGKGTLYYEPNGIDVIGLKQYEGHFDNGEFSGSGKLFFKNNICEYDGEFSNGKKSGIGQLFDMDGKLLYRGAFENGLTKDEFHQIVELKSFMKIRQCLEKNDVVSLKSFSMDLLETFAQKNNCNTISRFEKPCDVSEYLIDFYRKKKLHDTPDDKFDLFGNEIKNPVMGSDGIIYDVSSMEYLFLQDSESKKYVNIPYVNHEPKFPITTNGKILNSFTIL